MATVQVGSPDATSNTSLDHVSVVEKGKSRLAKSYLRTESHSSVVVVNLKATGNAPQLKTRKFNVDSSKTVAWLVQWLRKTLKCADDESVVSNCVVIVMSLAC